MITYGGAIIVDPRTGLPRRARTLPVDVVHAVVGATNGSSTVQPLMFAITDGRDRVCWLEPRTTEHIAAFLDRRRGDPRFLPVQTWDDLTADGVFYISLIGQPAPLAALRERLDPVLSGCHVVLGEDIYRPGEYWLELTDLDATKATAAAALRSETNADALVCFGDNHNDLPLFAIADHSLAVANAAPRIQQAASEVIDANSTEGVAKWLATNRHIKPAPRR